MNPRDVTQALAWTLVAVLAISVAACGGGGSSSPPSAAGNPASGNPASSAGSTPANPTTAPLAPTALPTASTAANTVPILVSSPQSGARNYPMVSVTVCTPGSHAAANCSTIDNVLVDTESFGLRLFASALSASTLATLPVQTQSPGGTDIAECAIFASGYAWGTVRSADVALSAEVALNVPIQVMTDPALAASAPVECQQNTAYSTPKVLGANGMLGIGVNPRDCGISCANSALTGFYYACIGASCAATSQPLERQVANPVQFFSVDNNGVVMELPPIAASGALSASGALVFGIDTQPNNTLAGTGATILTTSDYGDFDATYNGMTFKASASFDSGSPAMYFENTSISVNGSNFYTPATMLTQSVSIAGLNPVHAMIDFNVANADVLMTSGNYAFNDLAYDLPDTFDFGLPFFFGRHVYFGIVGTASAGGGQGPYVAYVPASPG